MNGARLRLPNIARWYQDEDVNTICAALSAGYSRVAIESATGTGKTTTASIYIKQRIQDGKRVLVNVDRREIVESLRDTIFSYCGLKMEFGNMEIGIEMADIRAPRTCKVVVASIQTLTNERMLALLEWFQPDDIVTDEADRAGAATNLALYEAAGVNSGKCNHVGFSATLERGDTKVLFAEDETGKKSIVYKGKSKVAVEANPNDCVFQKLLVRRNFEWGCDQGYLVDGIFFGFETETSLDDIPLNDEGDFQDDAVAARVDNAKRTLCIINGWINTCPDRQTIAFCASVEHAHHTAELWRQAGYTAECVDAKTPKNVRKARFDAFANGDLQILTNFGVIEKGMDFPACSCVCFLRPSRLRKYIVQCMGRGLRVLPLSCRH